MSKRPSLFHQLLVSMRNQERFGQSKFEAKQKAIAEAHSHGRTGFGVAPEGIYSVVTFAGYRQVAHEFATWCTKNGYARTMEEAKLWVPLYIAERICLGKSSWTIQRDRSALRKIFQDPELANEVEVPKRRLKDIKRSRRAVKMDKYFDPTQYPDLIDFCTATGLRRHELIAIFPEDIRWQDNKLIAFVRQGKGGKPREVTVMAGMENRVLEIIEGRTLGKPIFAKVPAKMDVHSYRREYSFMRQEQVAEIEVSRDLGHNRIDVIRGHYSKQR